MGKKIMSWKTKGMNRDLSVSAFNPEFAFENMNLRLSTVEGNTMLSWVSERGTLLMPCKEYDNIETDAIISGAPIGTAVINHKLVLFTTPNTVVDSSSNYDRIYLITFNDDKDKLVIKKLYEGNLNFCTKNPIETLVSYESETIQKVYWTDGRNQPRMINIVGNIKPDVDGQFDFVLSVELNKGISVEKTVGGTFSPGTIQYCFTYLNSYGQQTNIVDVTPLYYTTATDRGVSEEDKSNSKFNIYLYDLDTNFDYVRLYAISRSSLDGSIEARLLEDLPISGISDITINGETKQGLKYVDIGTGGSSIDPYELFYLGGKEVTALTMSDKDNTLFLGNLNLVNSDITPIQDYFNNERSLDHSIINFTNSNGIYIIEELGDNDLEDISDYSTYHYYEYKIKDTALCYRRIFQTFPMMPAYLHIEPEVGMEVDIELVFENNTLSARYFTPITNRDTVSVKYYKELTQVHKVLPLDSAEGTFYDNTFTLNHNSREIKTFKGGDTYRFGFQLQKKTGEWSEPIFIEDKNNDKYPRLALEDGVSKPLTYLPYAIATLDMQKFIDETVNNEPNPYYIKDFDKIYKRVRPVIVYPDITERHVLCQGVLNPTIFNSMDRLDKSPYAQPSWFFRPNTFKDWEGDAGNVPYIVDDNLLYNGYDPDFFKVPKAFQGYTLNKQALLCYVKTDKINEIRNRTSGQGKWISYTIYKAGGQYNSSTLQWEPLPVSVGVFYFDALFVLNESSNGYSRCLIIGKPGSEIPPIYYIENNQGYYTYYGGEWDFDRNTMFYSQYIYHDLDTINNLISDDRNPISTKDNYYSDLPIEFPVLSHQGALVPVSDSNSPYYCQLMYSNIYREIWPSQYDLKFYFERGAYHFMVVIHFYSPVTSVRLEGSKVEFEHFKHLFYDDEGNKQSSYYRQIEVQGATSGPYQKPYSLVPTSGYEGISTQFFIDSSIVTLNSPDIEFNEEVINQGTEGWKLRIVGAIPLTGGISSHFIERSTGLAAPSNPNVREELNYNTRFNNFDLNRGFNGYKKLISDYIWSDSWMNSSNEAESPDNYLVYPWQSDGPLNSDSRTKENNATSWLKRKKIANLSYSYNTEYIQNNITFLKDDGTNSPHSGSMYDFDGEEVSMQICLQDDGRQLLRLDKQATQFSDINYYPIINRTLSNGRNCRVIAEKASNRTGLTRSVLVSMKYKSGSHAVIAFKQNNNPDSYFNNCIPILPFAFTKNGSDEYTCGKYNPIDSGETGDGATGETFWGDIMHFKQEGIDIRNIFAYRGSSNQKRNRLYDFLWLGELYRDLDDDNLFGGTGRNALLSNKWVICGDSVSIPNQAINGERNVVLRWEEGDTYYQRYDCLKTYPYTDDDQNQIVEILSFMCESHVNLDGRYDKNRGQENNVNMTPEIFNLLNPNYTQHNNFFTQRKYSKDSYDTSKYPNMIWYSKTKTPGADVDLWTNIDLASILDLDGDKGELKSIQRFNNNLIAFQDKGISQILYNENVQVATENGVPVEIANSGKVQGKRYLSNTIGCSNKWSIANTPSGIYFMDSNNKGIYLFNGEIHNMSLEKGFDSWAKNNILSGDIEWTPDEFDNFVTHYDPINQDILFINKELCLAYSEKFGVFTSFYNYQNSPYFCNIDDTSLWVKKTSESNLRCQIYKHQAGDYCRFFGHNEPYSMTLIGNPEPQTDKIFTNLEFRANSEGEGTISEDKFTPTTPFDSIESWNEYQHGFTSFDSTTLRRKFRTWACNIPRDNVPSTEDQESLESTQYTKDSDLHITRFNPKAIDRMRNHWLYLKLKKNAAIGDNPLKKTEIHDISMTYFD